MRSLISLALRLLAVGGKFAAMVMLARVAGAREVGEFALFFGAINVALFVIGLDFHLFAIRELLARRTRAGRSRVILGQAVLDGVIYAAVAAIALVAAMLGIGELMPVSLFWFVSILILDHMAQEISRQFLVLRYPHASNVIYAVKTGLWGWIGAAAMLTGALPPLAHSFYMLWLIADALAVTGGLILLLKLMGGEKTGPPRRYRQWVARGLKVSRYFYVTSIATMCIAYLDRFIVARQVSLAEAGRYAFWQSITALIPVVVYATVGMHYLPRLVEAYQRRRHLELATFAREFRAQTLGIAGLAGIFIICCSFWIPVVLGKTEFTASYIFIGTLASAAAMNALWQVPYQVLYSAGDDRYLALILTSLTCLSVVFDAAVIPLFGIAGAAGVSLIVNGAIYVVLDRRASYYHGSGSTSGQDKARIHISAKLSPSADT